jgi:uncharacterized protein
MSPRPKRLRKIENPPVIKGFKPYGLESKSLPGDPIFLLYEEYEAIRLCDFESLNHTEASTIMEVSRPTLTRIYASARQKIAQAFVTGRQIIFEGGKVYFDSDWYECTLCTCYFNHPNKDKIIEACPLCKDKNIRPYSDGFEKNESGNSGHCEVCKCPKCGYEREHQNSLPYKKLLCPQCNVQLNKKL